MDKNYTPEKLNELSKEALVLMVLSMQEQLASVNAKLDKLTEQIAIANNYRFGRHTEKLSEQEGQGWFDADGNIYFNEAEAIHDQNPDPEEPSIETVVRIRKPRPKGKKEADLKGIPVIQLPTNDVPEEVRIREFGSLDNCRRMDDEVYKRLVFIPAGWKVEETHVAVYRSKTGLPKFVKGETPPYLLRGSIVSPSLESALINAKYVNAVPFRRVEKDFYRNGVHISEQNMASWTIKCTDRYLSRLYSYLRKLLISEYKVLQADETTVEVTKDGRKAGAKSYMWIYRTGQYYTDHPIVLYEYQNTRGSDHPLEFLKGFSGYLVCDGYGGYKTLDRKVKDIKIAECWAHARRKFSDAVKAAESRQVKLPATIAKDAIRMIAAIYHAEGLLQDLSPEERQKERMDKVRPLVDAFFAWVHKISEDKSILMSDKTQEGLQYCLNQESYLLTFLECGEIPLDNNRTEATIRGFTVGRKNWMMCDTISGAKSSAVIYSLVETAKANSLNLYQYFEYLLTELPKLGEFQSDEDEAASMERLLPWSEELPEICRKKSR